MKIMVDANLSEVKNLDQYRAMISLAAPVHGSRHLYTGDELVRIFDQIIAGKRPLSYMTRAHGLRDKLAKLI